MHQNEYRISKNVTPGSPLWGWTQSTGGAKKQTWPGAQFFHGTALRQGKIIVTRMQHTQIKRRTLITIIIAPIFIFKVKLTGSNEKNIRFFIRLTIML